MLTMSKLCIGVFEVVEPLHTVEGAFVLLDPLHLVSVCLW